MKTLKEQIDEVIKQIDEEDAEIVEINETAAQIDDLRSRIEELETSVKALIKVNELFDLWHRVNRESINLIVKTIDGKEE